MLPRHQRLTSGREITEVVRRGRRSGTRTVVLHVLPRPHADVSRAGLAVGRSVGNAVTRNQVKRRLRQVLAERLALLPATADVVLRALPPSASASSAELGADVDHAWQRAWHRAGRS